MAEIRSAACRPKQRRKEAIPAERKFVAESRAEETQAKVSEVAPGSSMSGRADSPDGTPVQMPTRRPGAADPRDSLLASIREAAGRPKRKTAGSKWSVPRGRLLEEKMERRKRPQRAVGGGDLMLDLVSKLRARRDGISGSFGLGAKPMEQEQVVAPLGQESLAKLSAKIEPADPLDTVQRRVMTQVSAMIPQLRPPSSAGREREDSNRTSSDESNNDDEWA